MNNSARNEQAQSTPRTRSGVHVMVWTLLWDVGLPVIAYFVAQLLGMSTYASLLTGTVVSALRMGWIAFRERRLDVFATFLLILFGTGFVLSFVTGDVRFLLAKDCATSAAAGIVFLVSCLIKRPLAYQAAKRFAGRAGQAEFLRTADTAVMRRRWYLVSLVWGVGLVTDSTLRIAAAYLLPLNLAVDVSQALLVASYTLLLGWTVLTSKQGKVSN
jgi:hypothetical protein